MLGTSMLAGEGETGLEPRGRFRRHTPADRHDVASHDGAGRIGEGGRDRSVAGEEEQARRRPIEAPDGHEASTRVAENVEDGLTALRIATSRHGASRLVEGDER